MLRGTKASVARAAAAVLVLAAAGAVFWLAVARAEKGASGTGPSAAGAEAAAPAADSEKGAAEAGPDADDLAGGEEAEEAPRPAASTIRPGAPPEGPMAEKVRAALAKYMAAKRLTPEQFGGDKVAMAAERRRLIGEAMFELVGLGDGAADATRDQIRAETGAVERCFLAAGLGRIDGPSAAAGCTELLKEATGLEQRDLIAMMKKGKHERSAQMFKDALLDPSVEAEGRANLVKVYLAQKPADAGAFATDFHARETDQNVRSVTISAVERTGDARAAPALATVVQTDPDPALREQALSAYGRLKPSDGAIFLGSLVADAGQSLDLRGRALDAAVALGTEEGLDLVRDVARNHHDPALRARADATLMRASLDRPSQERAERGGSPARPGVR